jgi:competence protein ComEC
MNFERHSFAATEQRTGATPFAVRDRIPQSAYQPLVWVFLAAASGMSGDRYLRTQFLETAVERLGTTGWLMLWWLASGIGLAMWYATWRRQRDSISGWLLLASLAFAAAGWHHWNWFLFNDDEAARFARIESQPTCVEAIACESAERVAAPRATPLRAIPGSEQSRLLVNLVGIRDGRSWRPMCGVCQLSVVGHTLWIRTGDRLRIFGHLARVSAPLNPGEFDFAAYARAEHRLTRIRSSTPESVTRISAGVHWSPGYLLDTLQNRAKQLVRALVGPQRAGLAAAILLGAREGLPFEETEPYLETGTIHVLVVSGMNVAILAVGLLMMLRVGWLPRRVGLCLIMAVVIIYALLAEAQPPVMRAAVLGVLACTAIWTGRQGLAFNSLFAAAMVVAIINPNDLFRAGPQLSFLAVAALIVAGNSRWLRVAELDPLDELVKKSRRWYWRAADAVRIWSWGLLITSFAVWLLTLPLVLFTFHVVSPIAIPASLAVWPLVTVAMWSGFVMVLTGWLLPWVGGISGVICSWSLAWLETLVHWADAFPYGHFWSPGPAWWWVAVFYLALLIVVLMERVIPPLRWQVAALALWIVVGTIPPIFHAATRDGLECSFMAVGHGACVVMRGPHGETVLYDAGSMGAPEYVTQSIASYLWHEGVTHIDGIIISHADTDHYNAVPGLLERFRVGAIYVSPVMFSSIGEVATGRGTKVLRDSIEQHGVPIHEVSSGNRLRIAEDLAIELLHPPKMGVLGPDNANSLVVPVAAGTGLRRRP